MKWPDGAEYVGAAFKYIYIYIYIHRIYIYTHTYVYNYLFLFQSLSFFVVLKVCYALGGLAHTISK